MNYEELNDLLKQVDEHNNTGNYDQAEKLANEVLAELDKQSHALEEIDFVEQIRAKAFFSLATTTWRRGRYDRAIEQAERILSHAEAHSLHDVLPKTHNLLGLVYNQLGNYDKALEYHAKALAVHEALGEKSRIATVTGNIGNVYNSLGSYAPALEYYARALATHEALGEKSGVARVNGNIGNAYKNFGSYDKALEYYAIALANHEALGDKSTATFVTGNIGSVYRELEKYDKALEYYFTALAGFEKLGQKSGIASFTGNIGTVYFSLGNYDLALEYYLKALAIHESLGEKSKIATVTGNIGALYAEEKYRGYNSQKAEEYLLKALATSTQSGYKHHLFTVHRYLSHLYENEKRDTEALLHFKKYIEIKDEVNLEEVKEQESIREQRKVIELAKAAAEARHQATQELLHNVLPPSIAHRMVEGEKLIAEKLPSVSVLFADIVGFTKLSQRITAEELVEGLDRIFSSFDTLAEKHGLEKIKTIGDAYMVVSGAPEPRTDHAEAMAEFALDMLEAMKEFTSKTTGEKIQLRIGIHSGEVVAGVIGKKKFAYDLWGDAVNTASRMESHGEAGSIHVSEEFVNHLTQTLSKQEGLPTDTPSLLGKAGMGFIERGEMEIKGKGIMRTYFLERQDDNG